MRGGSLIVSMLAAVGFWGACTPETRCDDCDGVLASENAAGTDPGRSGNGTSGFEVDSPAEKADDGDGDAGGDGGVDVASDGSLPASPCVPALEACDGDDNDCDGQVDEGFSLDGVETAPGAACTAPGNCGSGLVECDGDSSLRCSAGPGGSDDRSVAERCDDEDNDCDGLVDEDYDVGASCRGVGQCDVEGRIECASEASTRCSVAVGGTDARSSVEVCDGEDNDCDGVADEPDEVTFRDYYLDCDADGYADAAVAASPVRACEEPEPEACGGGWTTLAPLTGPSRDCNDGNANVFPGQEAFFDQPILGAQGEAAYDYNCDSASEPELSESYPLQYCIAEYGSEDVCNGFGECGEALWSKGYPVCGQRDSFIEWRRYDVMLNRYFLCEDRLPGFAPQRCR